MPQFVKFFDKLQTSRNTRRQGKSPDRRTKVRPGVFDAVSKNAFTEPFYGSVKKQCVVVTAEVEISH